MRTLTTLWTWLVALFLLAAAPVEAQDPWYSYVMRQLNRASTDMGLTASHRFMYGMLYEGQETSFTARLTAGETYYIIGRCDGNCLDLDLYLEDADGVLVRSDTDLDNIPVLVITPTYSQMYHITSAMAGCELEPCRWGVAILH